MSSHRPNPQLAKIHRSYTVEEIAETFDVHKNTVRQWIKRGLNTVDKKRPTLVLGHELREFLKNLRTRNKVKCKPGEIYCVRCRKPQKPAGDMADYQPQTKYQGNLVGICPTCSILIYRRVSLAKLGLAMGNLDVSFPQKD